MSWCHTTNAFPAFHQVTFNSPNFFLFLIFSFFCLIQAHHNTVKQLLQSSMRLLDCPWLQPQQKVQVESCIRTLAVTSRST